MQPGRSELWLDGLHSTADLPPPASSQCRDDQSDKDASQSGRCQLGSSSATCWLAVDDADWDSTRAQR